MPLRGLMYFGALYKNYVEKHELNIYGSGKVKIPTPRYMVFYNGERKIKTRTVLRLSDLYEGEGDIEVTATVININTEAGDELLTRCRTLSDYSAFISRIRSNKEGGLTLHDAVNEAIGYCVRNNILNEVLDKYGDEVIDMVVAEFNKEVYERDLREEGRIEGLGEGIDIGVEKGIGIGREEGVSIGEYRAYTKALINGVSLSDAMRIFDVTAEELCAAYYHETGHRYQAT